MRLWVWLSLATAVSWSAASLGDALIQNRSVESDSIIEFYIDEAGIRAELEIGMSSIPVFRNLMPDPLYERLGHPPRPLRERLQAFFQQDLAMQVSGEPLTGQVLDMAPGYRVLRDPVTGQPLPVQEGAPEVIRATLMYRFPEDSPPPAQLSWLAPRNGDIGFVAYHQGVAVNDFRYLSSGFTLTLDWSDPWYTRFNSRNLMRRYAEPMSGFLYVENFEVRKEIIARPRDLQRWVDLGLAGRDDIPVAMQPLILQKVGEFLGEHQAVRIDGEPVRGALQSVHFLERTLTSSMVIDPPRPLALDSAVIGAIFVYPRDGLPQTVTMDWDLWDERIQRIPVSAVDQAGPLPSYLDPEWPRLEWKNFLKNPDIPTLQAVEQPVAPWQHTLRRALPALALATLLCLIWAWRARESRALPLSAAGLLLTASLFALHYGGSNSPDPARADAITAKLLHNLYRAFDYREESDIYDVLAQSVSGELLTDIYLETRRSLVLAGQGGAQAKVKQVSLEQAELLTGGGAGQFQVEASWVVDGSVGHWGHIHQRNNRYQALLEVAVENGRWKIRQMDVRQEERL